MKWDDWKPYYLDIVRQLGLDIERDMASTEMLSELLIHPDPLPLLADLQKVIQDKTVIVCGAGPSLLDHLQQIKDNASYKDATLIAVDGATSAFLELEMSCEIIVTDLDGDHGDIISMVERGALPIVHAHGDNMSVVKEVLPKLKQVLGSTQVEPRSNVYLWGGFTDGDRACYVSAHYNPKQIILAGMDFGDKIGRWSKPGHSESFPASERKLIKLKIAEYLLSVLWMQTGIDHLFLEK
jgi:uncharacterized Rossmann fold enzyme